MSRQNLADGGEEVGLRYRNLRRPPLAPFLAVFAVSGGLGPLDQVLDLHFALGALLTALDDDAGGTALVGIFHLRSHAGCAKVHLRPNGRAPVTGLAQAPRQLLVIGDT